MLPRFLYPATCPVLRHPPTAPCSHHAPCTPQPLQAAFLTPTAFVDLVCVRAHVPVLLCSRGWELQRGTGSMAGGAGNGSNEAVQAKGSGGDGSAAKPLPPCCVKARSAAPESEAKCHATVVSGWFTEPRSHCGTPLVALLHDMYYFLLPLSSLNWLFYSTLIAACAGKATKVQYYNNPMWPGTWPTRC